MNNFFLRSFLMSAFFMAISFSSLIAQDIAMTDPYDSVYSSDPVPSCADVNDLQVSKVTQNSITVKWTHYDGLSEKYACEIYKNGATPVVPVQAAIVNPLSPCFTSCLLEKEFLNLDVNTGYIIKIKRICSTSLNLESSFVSITAQTLDPSSCSAPKSITANTSLNNASITIIPQNSIVPSQSFEIKLYKIGGFLVDSKVENISNSGSTIVFSNLIPCTQYYCEVKPVCGNSSIQTLTINTKCCGNITEKTMVDETTNSFIAKWSNSISAPTFKFSIRIKDEQNIVLKEIEVLYSAGIADPVKPVLNFSLLVNSSNFPQIQSNRKYKVDIVPLCECFSGNGTPSICATGEIATSVVYTNPPCITPLKFKTTNITDNTIAVSFEQQLSANKKKYFIEIVELTTNTVVNSEWLVPPSNGAETINMQFSNLKQNQSYKINLTTYCCDEENLVNNTCNWTINPNKLYLTPKTLTEPCKSVDNAGISTKTDTKITVQWQNNQLQNKKILVELVENSYVVQSKVLDVAAASQSYTFENLTPNSNYLVRLTSSCCVNLPECSIWDNGSTVTVQAQTDVSISPLCTSEPVTFSLVQEGNFIKVNWIPNTIQLSSSGRRFLVYTLSGLTIIDSPTNNALSGFTPGQIYNVKIREVFDGSNEKYNTACNFKDLSITTENPCTPDISITVKCLGLGSFLLEPDKPLASNMTLKVKYRDVSQKLLTSKNIDPQSYCSSQTFSNIPVDNTLIANWLVKNVLPNPNGKYILDGLTTCSIYELNPIILGQNNTVCKDILFPTYFHTLGDIGGVAPITDVNANGIDDTCEGFTPPPNTTVNNPTNLKKLICGQDPTPTPVQGTPYALGKVGDSFSINGFPFEIIDDTKLPFVKSGTNNYTGTGVMSIPFTDEQLLVEFKDITVIEANGGSKIVTSGTVTSRMDDTKVQISKIIDDINAKNNLKTEKFCNEPDDEIDGQGFNSKGEYVTKPPYNGYSDGAPFDSKYNPQGFDKNGLSPNGSKFNSCHCDAQGNSEIGFTCEPKKCEPYYWVADANSTEEGRKLYTKEKDKLLEEIQKILDKHQIKKGDTLALTAAKSTGFRTEMETIRAGLNYEKALVFGPNNSWINKGMSKFFDKTPIPFSVNMKRNAQHISLEEKHIKLYFSDLDEVKYEGLIAAILKLKDLAALDMFLKNVAFQIKTLEKKEAQSYLDDHSKFLTWLETVVVKKIYYDYKYTGKVTDASSVPFNTELENPNEQTSRWAYNQSPLSIKPKAASKAISLENIGQMAARDEYVMTILKQYYENPEKLSQMVEENLKFEYQQGFDKIGGISRAHILEAIHLKRKFLLGGNTTSVGTPLSKEKKSTGKNQNVYFDNFQFTPTGAIVDIYVIVDFQGKQQVFQILKAPIGAAGFKDPIKLALGSDISFALNNVARFTLKGGSGNGTATTTINGNAPSTNGGTYVVIGCDGFGGLNLDVKIEFCRKYFIPLSPVGVELADPFKVEATFKAQALSFSDVVIDNLSITPFVLANHKDFQFTIKNVVLDFSDTQTPSTVKFPNNYITAFSQTVNNGQALTPTPQWKGFYVGLAEIKLPAKWSGEGKPAKIAYAQDFIIDDAGISGICGVKNLLPKSDNGTMGGWKFTIDNFNLTVFHNKPIGAGMEGLIHLPILKDDEYWKYTAAALPNKAFQFKVSPEKESTVDLWLAKVKFAQNTSVDIEYINDEFKAVATLNGIMSVSSSNPNSIIKIEDIGFENVVISNQEAVVSPGKWTAPSIGAQVKGFSFFVQDIKLRKEVANGVTKTLLDFGVELTLANDDKQKLQLNAKGDFTVTGKVIMDADKTQKWVYQDIDINSFSIDCTSGGFSLNGALAFYKNDPNYGEGFYGQLGLVLPKIPGGIKAAAVFGKKASKKNPNELFKYFFVDIFLKVPGGIPVGPVSLSGLGGGVSWHMEKFNNPLIKLGDAPVGSLSPTNTSVGTQPPANAPKSLTGGVYIPNEDIGLGIKVMTTLELYGNARAFNGAAALEVIFKDDGGLKLIEFSGVAHFMAEPEKNPSFILNTASIPEGIHAGLNLKYDFDHDIFTAQMLGYASVAGELEGCDGGCQSKKMGQIDMYFDSKKWYINIGRTNLAGTDRIALGINAHGFGYLSASAYLNIGTGIKPMPPLPAYAQKLVGNSVKINDESTRASGNGFAFGADIKFQFGTKQDAFIYGLVSVDLGFDVMMQDYGKAKCKNTQKQIGLNGWYASGQMYTQIKGDIGVKVKNKKFPILSVGVEAALQEKGPNPFWASGGLAVNYNLLFGLVKGSSQFKIEIGQQCELESDPATNGSSNNNNPDTEIITAISPDKSTTDVSVSAKPVISFNQRVGKTTMTYDPDNSPYLALRVIIKELLVTADNVPIDVKMNYNGSGDVLTLEPTANMLPANKKIKIHIKAAVAEMHIGTNNEPTEKVVETLFEDERNVEFTTEKLTKIPSESVLSSYPSNGMFNYYTKEDKQNRGEIFLKSDFSDLLSNPSDDKQALVRIFKEGNLVKAVHFSYTPSEKKISFTMPNESLENDKVYKMELVFAENATPSKDDQILLTQYFRSSIYPTFYDKLQNVNVSSSLISDGDFEVFFQNINEPFAASELEKTDLDYTYYAAKVQELYKWYNNKSYNITFNPSGSNEPPNEVFKGTIQLDYISLDERIQLQTKQGGTMQTINEAAYLNPQLNYSSSNVYSFKFQGYSSGAKVIDGLKEFYNKAALKIDQNCDSEYSYTTEKTDCKATKKDLPQVPQFNTPTPTSTTFNFNYYLPSGVLTSKVEKKVNH